MSELENGEPVEQEPAEVPQVDDDPAQDEGVEPDEAPSEPDAEPAPPPPVDEDREKLAKSLSTRYESYKKSMIERLGDEAPEWIVCPLCTSSMAPGFVNVHDFGRVPDEIKANVDTYFGVAREQDYAQDPDTETCPTCRGKCKVKTGAESGEWITRKCRKCNGYGFVPPPSQSENGVHVAGTPEEAVAAALADFDTEERDNWGEPRILPDGSPNSNFGKMPQFKTVHPVYGVTANLSPEELISG